MQEHQLSYREKGTGKAKLVLGIITCVLLVAFLAMATGCRDTDALREIIVDQNSDIIDYDNPLKFYINDSTAEEESDQVSSLEVSDEDPESDIVQNLIIYSSDPNTEGFTAKRSFFSATPDFTGIEASETVFFYHSDDIDAFNHAVTPTPDIEDFDENSDDEETNTENVQYISVSNGGNATNAGAAGGTAGTATGAIDPTSTSGTEGTDSTDEGQETQGEGSASGGEGDLEGLPDEEGGGVGGATPLEEGGGSNGGVNPDDGSGGGEAKPYTPPYDPGNRDDDLPHYEAFAAFGEYAPVVQMIGGSGALVATENEMQMNMTSAGVQTTAVGVWGNTSAAYQADGSGLDVEALVAAFGDIESKCILVYNVDDFITSLSNYQYNYLIEENHVDVISLIPSSVFSTSDYIKTVVSQVGESLQGSTVAAYGSVAQDRASEYWTRHDSMLEVNGGLADGSPSYFDSQKILQTNSSNLDYSSNEATYTVLIDYWDDTAEMSLNAGYHFGPGAAYASRGYATSPVSFYIQEGGTINTAASRSSTANYFSLTGEIPVLQFMGKDGSENEGSWSNTQLTNIDYSGYHALLDSGVDGGGGDNLGKGFGSDSFPKVIVTSTSIKDSIVENSYGDGTNDFYSLYHPWKYAGYDILSSAIGLPNSSIWTSIGRVNDTKPTGDPNSVYTEGYIYPEDVLVNPHGLICTDWTQGTVESFLETGFVAAYINRGTTGYDRDRWRTDVTDFYQWAWGITPNMDAIDENGAECVN